VESGIGNQNPESETRIWKPETKKHKSKKTSSSNTQKVFTMIAFACGK